MATLRKRWQHAGVALLLALSLALLTACGDDEETAPATPTPTPTTTETAAATGTATPTATATAGGGDEADVPALKIGYLADFSGALAEFGPEIQKGVELAVQHINDAGGVNGKPVELVTGDTQLDQTAAIEEARRLVDIEGVAGIVGPLASTITIAVGESVTGPAGVVTISPSATSPAVSAANDNDFLFRSTTSDAAQGVVLAELARQEGYERVGVLYLNDAYGQGLADVFAENFGTDNVSAAAYEDGQSSYLSELQSAADGGSEALIAIGFPTQAQIFIREALENGLFDRFLFVDGTKSEDLINEIGADPLEGMKGTAPAPGPETEALRAWNEAFEAEHGAPPTRPFVREAYDAAVAIALAAEAADSVEGAAIRDMLREIAGPPGDEFIPGAEGVAAALEAVRAGTDIDFQGAVTSLDWDENGDVTTGFIGIWQYQDGAIVELEEVPFELGE